jgi:hypothetical protein
MKIILTLLVTTCFLSAFGQKNKFVIQGKVVNRKGDPVADVYVINPHTLEKDITQANGIFSINVLPEDSLIFSHISYYRKSVQVHSLLQNNEIILDAEDVKIPEVIVSPHQKTELERAKKNLSFLNDYKAIKYNKMEPDSDPLQATMTEHNRLMRTEAGSISLLPILGVPLKAIDKTAKKRKRRKYARDYSFTKDQKETLLENE